MLKNILLLFVFIGCGRLNSDLIKENGVQKKLLTSTKSESYTLDSDDILFENENLKWSIYTGPFGGHKIISKLNVYLIKTQESEFYLQFLDYYENNEPGKILIRVQKKGENEINKIYVDAVNCHALRSEPEKMRKCMAQKNHDQYRYLNLDTLVYKKQSVEEAFESRDWDIALYGREARLNNGLYGNKNVKGSIVFEEVSFFEVEKNTNERKYDYVKIAKAKLDNKDIDYFKSSQKINFPKFSKFHGASSNIQLSQNDSKSSNDWWWLVKGEDNYYKVNFFQTESDDLILNLYIQLKSQSEFSTEKYGFAVLKPKETTEYCIVFYPQHVFNCSESKNYDLKLTYKEDKYQVFTKNGSIGPLSKLEMELIKTGK